MKRAKQIGIENVNVVSVSSSGRKTGGQDQAVEQGIALHNKTLHSKWVHTVNVWIVSNTHTHTHQSE